MKRVLSALCLATAVIVPLSGCGYQKPVHQAKHQALFQAPKKVSSTLTTVPKASQSPTDSAAVFATKAYPIVKQIAGLYNEDTHVLSTLVKKHISYNTFTHDWDTNELKIDKLDQQLASIPVGPRGKTFQTKLVGYLNQRLQVEKQFQSAVHHDGTANQSAFHDANQNVSHLDKEVENLFVPYINAKG